MFDRRSALALLTTATASGLTPLRALAREGQEGSAIPKKVVVVGAGILGVSAALHLSALGAQVTLIDRAAPGSGATQGAFAMLIPFSESGDATLDPLYGQAVAEWRRLQLELPGELDVQWGGMLNWAPPGEHARELQESLFNARLRGAPVRSVDLAEFNRLAPNVAPGPFGFGTFLPAGGTVNPMHALSVMLEEARRKGVQVQYPCRAQGFAIANGVLSQVETTDGPIEADAVIIAAGSSVPFFGDMLETRVPINLVSGALAHSRPFPRVLDRVLLGPLGTLKQDMDNRIVTGPNYSPNARARAATEEYGRELLDGAIRYVPSLEGIALEKMTVGIVPIPEDGWPILGRTRSATNAYILSSMSGITMAPLLGRIVATEVIFDLEISHFQKYNVRRFNQ